MKTLLLTAIVATAVCISSIVSAEPYKGSKDSPDLSNEKVVVDLIKSAEQAARASGVDNAVGSISCDRFLIHCSCKGAFHCAWLAWGCSASGGIQGFDGECFFPSSVPSANSAIKNFKARIETGPVGPVAACPPGSLFCTCSGPSSSADCNTIRAKCADDFLCIGDECSCVNGSTD